MCPVSDVGPYGLSEEGFILDTAILMVVVVIPAAAFFLSWRLSVTNTTQSLQRLSLKDSVVDVGPTPFQNSWLVLLLACTTTIAIFMAGVLVFEVFVFLVKGSFGLI